MDVIYTKDGRPLKVSGQDLISRSGKHVAPDAKWQSLRA